MYWQNRLYAICALLIATSVSAQTIIPGGSVSGTWSLSGSPYFVEDEIAVRSNELLTIEPGVDVIFRGHYKFIVNGWLEAVGTASDSILFTAADSAIGWWGIRFINAPDSSHLAYCTIENGNSTGGYTSPDACGGGIYCDYSNPVIEYCTIRYNHSQWRGGALYCRESSPLINGCKIIENNAGSGDGGGIYCEEISCPLITNCDVSRNQSFRGGGMFFFNGADAVVINCRISENTIPCT